MRELEGMHSTNLLCTNFSLIDDEIIPLCHQQNLTFFFLVELSELHITDNINHGENCELSVEFSECTAPGYVVEQVVPANERNLTIDITFLDTFPGNNIVAETMNSCEVCGATKYYIPDMRLTG